MCAPNPRASSSFQHPFLTAPRFSSHHPTRSSQKYSRLKRGREKERERDRCYLSEWGRASSRLASSSFDFLKPEALERTSLFRSFRLFRDSTAALNSKPSPDAHLQRLQHTTDPGRGRRAPSALMTVLSLSQDRGATHKSRREHEGEARHDTPTFNKT